MTKKERERWNKLRVAVAKYMRSEGCSCCRGEDHEKHREIVGDLLEWPRYPDGEAHDYFAVSKQGGGE